MVKNTFLLIFFHPEIAQNGTFLDNFKYDCWILHKKIVLDEIFTIFHKITYISFNIGPRILNVHTLGHPFPSAGHIFLFFMNTVVVQNREGIKFTVVLF